MVLIYFSSILLSLIIFFFKWEAELREYNMKSLKFILYTYHQIKFMSI